MASKATTVSAYLSELPPERRKEVERVRSTIRKHLPKGYAETLQYGMITWVVPLKLYPNGYRDQPEVPLPFASLAAQKSHSALYLMSVSADPKLERWFRAAWANTGKRLDMGKSCVRFKQADELALDVIGEAVSKTSVDEFVRQYEAGRPANKAARAKRTAKKTP